MRAVRPNSVATTTTVFAPAPRRAHFRIPPARRQGHRAVCANRPDPGRLHWRGCPSRRRRVLRSAGPSSAAISFAGPPRHQPASRQRRWCRASASCRRLGAGLVEREPLRQRPPPARDRGGCRARASRVAVSSATCGSREPGPSRPSARRPRNTSGVVGPTASALVTPLAPAAAIPSAPVEPAGLHPGRARPKAAFEHVPVRRNASGRDRTSPPRETTAAFLSRLHPREFRHRGMQREERNPAAAPRSGLMMPARSHHAARHNRDRRSARQWQARSSAPRRMITHQPRIAPHRQHGRISASRPRPQNDAAAEQTARRPRRHRRSQAFAAVHARFHGRHLLWNFRRHQQQRQRLLPRFRAPRWFAASPRRPHPQRRVRAARGGSMPSASREAICAEISSRSFMPSGAAPCRVAVGKAVRPGGRP